jgi:seryl-tRNA synthetase
MIVFSQAATYAGTARDPFAPSMSLEQIAEHSPARQMSNLAVAEAQQQKLARDRLKAATEALRQRRGRMFALSQSLSAATADAHMAAVQQSIEGQTEQEKQASEVKEEQGADSKLEIEKMQVECDQLEALISHLTEIVRRLWML